MNTLIKRASKLGASKQSGFTLVELMIVVAIIGILSSIAIPNYQKYQAKARTSEAKIYLSGAFTAEKSFIVEYSSYTGCLGAAGFAADAGQNYYTIGIQGAATAATVCGQSPTTGCLLDLGTNAPTCVTGSPNDVFLANKVVRGGGTLPVQVDLTQSTVTTNLFVVQANGQVSPANGVTAAHDRWTINQSKALVQVTVGY